jgi:adenosylhomocysteine nucleosidase
MKVLVTFAVDAEFAPWRKLRHFERLPDFDVDCYSSRIGDLDVRVLLTGIGGKKAWLAATKLIWNGDIDVCISSGLAGALRPEHVVGEVLAAWAVNAASWKKLVPADSTLLDLASGCGAKPVARFYSADHVVVASEEKRKLGVEADAVEMESGEILCEATGFGAKAIAVRAISDGSEEDLPLDFNRVTTEDGDLSMARVAGQVARNPGAVPSLIRFGQQSRAAAEALADFLERFLSKLAVASFVSPVGGVDGI